MAKSKAKDEPQVDIIRTVDWLADQLLEALKVAKDAGYTVEYRVDYFLFIDRKGTR